MPRSRSRRGRLERRELSSAELVEVLAARVDALDRRGPRLESVLAMDPRAADRAARLDAERAAGRVRGPLHGIPVLVKDNVETAGILGATAGSLALSGVPVARDADAVVALRRQGAIVLGKTNLSEWANFRSRHSSSGWSAVGGQTRNPHALDRSPGGSSSGTAAAIAAGLSPVGVGTETDGSIVCPAAMCGVVGLKPTHARIPAGGVIPLAATQDCVGPIARTVADAALAFDAMCDHAMAGTAAVPLALSAGPDGLAGARIGVAREHYTGHDRATDELFARALDAMRDAGAVLVDPADVPTAAELARFDDELVVLTHELHDGLDRYLARRAGQRGDAPRSLAELVEFNEAHAREELALFGQDLLVESAATAGLDDAHYLECFERNRERARRRGVDAALAAAGVDALFTVTAEPAAPIDHVNGDPPAVVSSSPAAVAGYPSVTIPIGSVRGLPVGASFVGPRGSEPTLVRLASGLEHVLGPGPRPRLGEHAPAG